MTKGDGFNPLAPAPAVADTNTIRNFVKEMGSISEKVTDARDDLKQAVKSNEEVIVIEEKIKILREEMKEVILNSPVIQGYKEVLGDVMEEKRQLISDAKTDGVPKKEIDLAIKALKQDIDMVISTDVYAAIADLID